jgi:hypothetical protein
MKQRLRGLGAALVTVVVLVGCGDNDSAGPTGSVSSAYSGTQTVTAAGRTVTTSVEATFTQNGSQVTGTFRAPGGPGGTFSGTIRGAELDGTLLLAGDSCAFDGTLSGGGGQISGSFTCGSGARGSIVLMRA